MTLINSLVKTYDKSLEAGLVDNYNGKDSVILPLYHNSIVSTGENILKISIDKDSNFVKSSFLAKDDKIIFPVSLDSVNRTSNSMPHMLVDNCSYIASYNEKRHNDYMDALENWLSDEKEEEIKEFIRIIYNYIKKENFIYEALRYALGVDVLNLTDKDSILEYTFLNDKNKETRKKLELDKIYLEFEIIDFKNHKDYSVTNYTKLHQVHINNVRKSMTKNGVCNITGKEDYIVDKHRGILGNSKLISSVKQSYIGRFKEGSDVISIGYETSEKAHLMLKYLMDNKNSSKWLGGQQYIVNWFSDDVKNEKKLFITSANPNLAGVDEADEFDIDKIETKSDTKDTYRAVYSENEKVANSFITGVDKVPKDSIYSALIVEKVNDGRSSIRYFKELQTSELYNNIEKWSNTYYYYTLTNNYNLIKKTPSIFSILDAAYGTEREKKLVNDNDSFKKDQLQKMIVSIIEGKEMPKNIVKAIDMNIRKKLNYKNTWNILQSIALAVLRDSSKEENKDMLDRDNLDRSYLYGRLLAVYEMTERLTFDLAKNADGEKGKKNEAIRLTNADRYWTSYTKYPAKITEVLDDKTKTYMNKLKATNPGFAVLLDREKEDIFIKLGELDLSEKEDNKALSSRFLYGYYAEKRFGLKNKESNKEEK